MNRLIDPKIVMAIKDLPLAARTTVDGFLAGLHNSNLKGIGMEFSQYRSYQPGDDLRRLDWKMYARSDRYYIRESEVETSIGVRFLIDASASMNHNDGRFTKIEYARYIAASLAALALSQGDSVGLHVFQSGQLYSLPGRNYYQHLQRICHQLEKINPEGDFRDQNNYKSLLAGSSRKEILVFITDFYERDGELMRLLDTLVTAKHEVIVLHLMAENEMMLDYNGISTLEDLETGERINIGSKEVKEGYKERLQAYLQHIKTTLLGKQIHYRFMNTGTPIENALRDFLIYRNKQIR